MGKEDCISLVVLIGILAEGVGSFMNDGGEEDCSALAVYGYSVYGKQNFCPQLCIPSKLKGVREQGQVGRLGESATVT